MTELTKDKREGDLKKEKARLQPPVSCLHMLKVVKGLKVRGWEFARHWVDELPPRIIIVGMHWNTGAGSGGRAPLLPHNLYYRHNHVIQTWSSLKPNERRCINEISLLVKTTIYNLWKTLLWQARVVSAAQMNTNYLSYKLHSLKGIVSFLLCFLCTGAVVICDVVLVQCWIAVVICTPRVYHKRLRQ